MDIEALATSAVNNALAVLPRVQPFIKYRDKEPSWDGNIYLCSDNNHSKKNISKIPIQVKGHCEEVNEQQEILFSVEIVDLENYYRDGGCLYFVVYISPEDPRNTTVFYNALLPYDLRIILREKKHQEKTLIKLKRFPDDQIDALNILLQFTQDAALQAILPAISDEEMSQIRDFKLGEANLSMSYTILTSRKKFLNTLLNLSGYMNRDVGFGIKIPVAKIDHWALKTEISQTVACDGRIFFNSFQLCCDREVEEIKIGTGISIIINEKRKSIKLNYTPCGTLAQEIIDIECLHAIIQSGKITLGEKEINIKVAPFPPDVMRGKIQRLEYLKTLQDAFMAAGYKGDVNINDFSLTDWEKSQVLISTFIHNKSLFNSKSEGANFFCFTIGNVSLLLLICQNGSDNQVFNPYTSSLRVKVESGHDNISVSPFCFLSESNLITVSKLDFDAVMDNIKSFKFSAEYHFFLIQLLLRMLCAIDSGAKDPDMLSYSELLAQWLFEQDENSAVNKINLYQVFKRKRDLTAAEISSLHKLLESQNISNEQKAGIYILLSACHNFSKHFNMLSQEQQKAFINYPILNLLPETLRAQYKN